MFNIVEVEMKVNKKWAYFHTRLIWKIISARNVLLIQYWISFYFKMLLWLWNYNICSWKSWSFKFCYYCIWRAIKIFFEPVHLFSVKNIVNFHERNWFNYLKGQFVFTNNDSGVSVSNIGDNIELWSPQFKFTFPIDEGR